MNGCVEFELMLSLQLDDMLTQEESAALSAHLQDCPSCRALQAELLQLHGDMTLLRAQPPAGLLERMRAQVFAETAEAVVPLPVHSRGKKSYRRYFASVAAIAILVSAVALGQGLNRSDETSLAAPNAGNEMSLSMAEESTEELPMYETMLSDVPAEDVTSNTQAGNVEQPPAAAPKADLDMNLAEGESAQIAGYGTDGSRLMPEAEEQAQIADAVPIEPMMPMMVQEEPPMPAPSAQTEECAAHAGASGTALNLRQEDALSLLQGFLDLAPENERYSAITYAGLDEAGENFIFRVTYPNQTEVNFTVNRDNGSIFPQKTPDPPAAS